MARERSHAAAAAVREERARVAAAAPAAARAAHTGAARTEEESEIDISDFMASLLSNTPLPDRAHSTSAAVEEEDSSCIICMEAERTHLFVPCGHRCVCEACAALVMSENSECPMCRVPAIHIVKVYE